MSDLVTKRVSILGTRGIPGLHGGFETFAEQLAVYLTERGWEVTVYCQETLDGFVTTTESQWKGVRRVHIPVRGSGSWSTVIFDLISIRHAAREPGIFLTLGYNTAIFDVLLRLAKRRNVINMDGFEWKRQKWRWHERAWLYANEKLAFLLGDHLIADHPEMERYLTSRTAREKVTMIPYGARNVVAADESRLGKFGLKAREFAIVIARPEPENNVLSIVHAFSGRMRGHKLVILGDYQRGNKYHDEVRAAASNEVLFLGPVYEHKDLDALRFFASLYIHGHTVGGTNPSLVEALGAGQPVLAHDNVFNRWVSGPGAAFFKDEAECAAQLDEMLGNYRVLKEMSTYSRKRFNDSFQWRDVLGKYEALLEANLEIDSCRPFRNDARRA